VQRQPVLLLGGRPLVTARSNLLREPRIRREGEEAGPVAIAQLSVEVEGAGIPYQLKSDRPAVRRELRQRQTAQFCGAHAEGRHSVPTGSVLIMLESELDALA
jgi:hypothetical protein